MYGKASLLHKKGTVPQKQVSETSVPCPSHLSCLEDTDIEERMEPEIFVKM